MKIALLTIWKVCNFGAEMQTYATVKALQRLGHDVIVIDYRLNEPRRVKDFIVTFFDSLTPSSHKFNLFWDAYIPSTKHYYSSAELKANPPKADLYLVGSDQVWNPAITKEKCLDFFFSFLQSKERRSAYASSFGCSKWPTDKLLTDRVKEKLLLFENVSCREQTGVEILKDIFGLTATCVLDPTLLFSGYPELTGEIVAKETFVYYPLFGGQEMDFFCKEIASMLNLKFIDNNRHKYWLNGRIWDRPSVAEWVRNFAEAKYVATQSFHGTAFSLIYKKQFFTVYSGNKVSRIADLLDSLGILDRLYPSVEAAREARPWETPIDYVEVDKRLCEMRRTSWDYLKDL